MKDIIDMTDQLSYGSISSTINFLSCLLTTSKIKMYETQFLPHLTWISQMSRDIIRNYVERNTVSHPSFPKTYSFHPAIKPQWILKKLNKDIVLGMGNAKWIVMVLCTGKGLYRFRQRIFHYRVKISVYYL